MIKTKIKPMALFVTMSGKGRHALLVLFFVLLSVMASTSLFYIYARDARAATSSTVNFQARILKNTGSQVADGNYSIQFKIYPAVSGGVSSWNETQVVTVKNGYVSVSLGSATAFGTSVDWSQEQWLTMNINGDGEMAPRMKITATPYSFRSGQSDTLTNGSGTISASQLVQLSPSAMQTTNSAGAGIMLDQTGTGGLLQLRGNGSDVLTLSKTGNLLAAGLLNINGASVTVGTATQQGSLILNDGSGKTASILPTALSANTTYTLPSTGGIFCMQSSSGCGFASSSLAFANGGNLFGGLASLGTNDNNALAFRTNSAEVARFTAGGSLVIGGGATTSRNGELVDINGSLRSNKLLVGSGADFSILPVASGQSVVSSLWGLQLVGNKQTAVDYSPANIGLKDDFSVIIPNQQATKTALVIKGQTSQSGDLIQLQDISGQTLSRFDATGQLVLDIDAATPTPAKIILNDATAANGFTSSLTTSNLTSSRNISLPDEGGVVCLSNSNNCGYIRLASGTAQTDATANNTIFINKTNASGSLISLTNTGNSVFTVANNGALEIRSTSTVALNIKNATGTDFFNVDTSGGIVRIGPAVGDTTGVMLVLDSKTSAGDPTGSNGGMYYNANANKFRCYENSAWKNCINDKAFSLTTIPGVTAATAAKAATTTILVSPLYIPAQTTVNQIKARVTTALGAAGDIGIYDANGNLVINGGASTLTTTTGLKTVVPVQTGAARMLDAGQYYVAMTWNSTTGVVAGANIGAAGVVSRSGTIAAGGGLVLPATITLSGIVNGTYLYGVSINN